MVKLNVCRHRNVEWMNAKHCLCNQCGRRGEWLDSFMFWARKRESREVSQTSSVTVVGAKSDSRIGLPNEFQTEFLPFENPSTANEIAVVGPTLET